MTLTYIFHSGFVLETEQSILVFDYWMDPSGVMDGVLGSKKPLYVLSSHFHEDHFTREIFEWKKRKPNITYIMSKDILRHRRANKDEADAWLAKGASWADERISVRALGSTDSGVSWIVETGGKRIFHAGDLCNWYARFLPDAVSGQTIYSEELTEQREPSSLLGWPSRDGSRRSQFAEDIDPIAHEKQYLGELKDIRKVADSFDIVMFPIDGRTGNGYTLGGRQFIERFKVGMFVPMHFTTGFEPNEQREQSRTCSNYAESRERKSGAQSAWRMKEFTDEKNISFWKISREGETIDIQ